MSGTQTGQGPEVRMSGGGDVVVRWPGERWQLVGGTNDGEVMEDAEVAGWTEMVPRQEGVTTEAEAVLVGAVDSSGHGTVQAELRQIQVAVRGQMDGIRPIEAVVLTYRWTPKRGWVFEELETLVQGMAGELKPGTVLASSDFAALGPVLGWPWDLATAMRPRG